MPAKPEVFYSLPRVHVFADLMYERAPNALICPDERTFRQRVQVKMGIDSFNKNPRGVHAGRVRVQVSRTPSGFTASYTWIDTEGATKTGRFTTIGASDLHCFYALDEVASRLAGHLSILELNLGAKLARRSEPKKLCAPAECPPPIESNYSVWPKEPPMLAPKEQSKLPERWPLAVRLGVAVWPEIIVTSRGSLGLSAELGVRYRFLSAGAELHGNPPIGSFLQTGVGEVSFARLSGALVLCGHYSWFVGCGVGDVGRMFFLDSQKLPASALYVSAGVRMGAEFPVAPPRFFLRASLDLRTPIRVVSYTYRDITVFQTAGLGVGAVLGFVAELGP